METSFPFCEVIAAEVITTDLINVPDRGCICETIILRE
jgi:hypothetical protein